MTTVAAVVVTFNRKDLLLECLDALLNQTRKVDCIYLVDNASSDGTQALLAQRGYLDHERIQYQRMAENLGGAGGFAHGVNSAYLAGHDWIWVMDDDAEPHLRCLAEMERYFSAPDLAATCPLITDASGALDMPSHHRGWFIRFIGEQVVRPVTSQQIVGKEYLHIDHCSFVGLCFKGAAIAKIGLPRANFFIHYDDLDFCVRLRSQGHIALVIGAVIQHKEAAKRNVETTVRRFGRASRRMNYDKLWIRYFGYRNRAWLVWSRKIDGSRLKLLTVHLRLLVGIAMYDDKKWQRISFWNAALLDGLSGNFDNLKPKRLLD